MKYIDEKEVSRRLAMPECIRLMEEVFKGFARGSIKNQLRTVVPMEGNVLGLMPSVIPAEKAAGAKIITVVHDNSKRNLPSHQGIVAVFDTETGSLKGVVDGTSVTAVRTGAVSGLATKYMSRENARTLCLIGGGVQAEMNLAAVCAVRDIKRVNVWCRTRAGSDRFINKVKRSYPNVELARFADPAEAVREADIICTVTPGKEIVLKGEWVKPGTHINAVGACARADRELDGDCTAKGRFFADNIPACLAESGDLLIAVEEGKVDKNHLLGDLGQIVTGRATPRESDEDITIFESLGLAEEDIICANWLLEN